MFRKIGFWLILALLVVAAGGGYAYYSKAKAAPQATAEPAVQTSVVRRGNLVISASGTGSVISTTEIKLSFQNSGRLSELLVQVGDNVKAGDVLAYLESSESAASLAAQLSSAEITVLNAQKNLDDLKAPTDAVTLAQAESDLAQAQETLDKLLNPSETAISQAELAVIDAQSAVDDAQYAVNALTRGRGSQEQVEAARAGYLLAQDKVDRMQDLYDRTKGSPEEDAGKALALSNLAAAKSERDRALANLNWFLGKPSAAEIAEKNTKLALAKAQLADAQETLANLQNPKPSDIALAKAQVADLEKKLEELKAGPDPDDIKLADAELANAQAQLTIKQEAMAKQSLVAPMDGTVLAISANVGDAVGTSQIITLADLNQPMLEVFVDETDMNQIGIGYEVEVVFDALPDQTFTGHVVSVDPSLAQSGMVQAVRGVVQLDAESFAKPQTLPIGLNASVEVIGSKAENALLVPVEALREISAGKYGVFVMENGQPTLKVVEVGLMDLTYAEIKSGLNEGDVVTTGVVETGQ